MGMHSMRKAHLNSFSFAMSCMAHFMYMKFFFFVAACIICTIFKICHFLVRCFVSCIGQYCSIWPFSCSLPLLHLGQVVKVHYFQFVIIFLHGILSLQVISTIVFLEVQELKEQYSFFKSCYCLKLGRWLKNHVSSAFRKNIELSVKYAFFICLSKLYD